MLDRDQDPRSRAQAPYEHRFYALLRSEFRPSRPALALLLAVLSLVCVALSSPSAWASPFGYIGAVAFVLAAHDLGHALAARAHCIELGLPLWLPFPALGSLGSFLQLRAPFKTRRDLFDVALAGPVAGILASTLLLSWGLQAAAFVRLPEGAEPRFLEPLLARVLASGAPTLPPGYDFQGGHLLFAGRLGICLGFLNLIPGGVLDGALLARALFGRRGLWLGPATAVVLVSVAAATRDPWWLAWAGLAALPRRRIPPPLNPFLDLGALRWILAGATLLLAGLCAMSPRVFFSGW